MNFQPIKPDNNQKTKVKVDVDWPFIASQHQLEVTVNELLQAASSYPLFFIKNSKTGATSVAAITSFAMDSNVLVNENGEHNVAYVPLAARTMPFALGIDPKNEKSIIPFINTESGLVGEEEGELLFDGEQATSYFQQINQQLEQLYHDQITTAAFINELNDLSLIQPIEVELTMANNEKSTLKGLYHLDEEAFNKLTEEKQMSLLSKGYYSGVYAMLSSLTQINRLIQGHVKQGEGIAGVNIKVAK
ncbi:SapC family protein [Thalassotalea sp. M1531]|uniref:SapC family protein n=1 Tax=Thalassotalea algicola TaxID=2716224 RepID=A0A7Y0Q5D2_9GAMM|nr:SapC family protein [Thalassotalea algicola]NMP30183.1 SapC family protein [Thalassotalea algicola]